MEVITEPRNHRQWFAYNEYYLEQICQESRWIVVFDLDEFLFPMNGEKNILEVLNNYDGADPWLFPGLHSAQAAITNSQIALSTHSYTDNIVR